MTLLLHFSNNEDLFIRVFKENPSLINELSTQIKLSNNDNIIVMFILVYFLSF